MRSAPIRFNMPGPPPEEPRPGMFADAVYNVRPGPGNMGLVVIEPENHGYELEFEETPPADTSAPNGEYHGFAEHGAQLLNRLAEA